MDTPLFRGPMALCYENKVHAALKSREMDKMPKENNDKRINLLEFIDRVIHSYRRSSRMVDK